MLSSLEGASRVERIFAGGLDLGFIHVLIGRDCPERVAAGFV